MSESTRSASLRRGTPRASLAALGVKLCQLDLFAPIRQRVHVPQKTVRYSPADKLYDAFVACLAGAHGMVELNRRLRADPALQAAFGRTSCAEQSVVQDTLDACTPTSVAQMEAAIEEIYQQQSRGYRHDYKQAWQILDVDLTGMPCGRKAAFATRGYFVKQRNRRGRQLGRVLATRYQEVVVDRLFPGNASLPAALQTLIAAAERTLSLTPAKRRRTIVRVDGGGGRPEDVRAILSRGYQFHGKEYSAWRARKLASQVTRWIEDPRMQGRQVGWVTGEAPDYGRPVRRIAVRCPRKDGTWAVGVLISTLAPEEVRALLGKGTDVPTDEAAELLAYVYFYDQRGGGVETAIKEDKQGLGITKRNKKRFEAQQMLVQLNALAHNVLIWGRGWLIPAAPAVRRLGVKRLVRDVFGVSGTVAWDRTGQVRQISLNPADRLAHRLQIALQALVGADRVAVSLGET
jgi:hypothetical protein